VGRRTRKREGKEEASQAQSAREERAARRVRRQEESGESPWYWGVGGKCPHNVLEEEERGQQYQALSS
jgi:hypothetical protein